MKHLGKTGLALVAGMAVASFGQMAHAQRVSTLPGKGLVAMCSQKAGVRLCDAYLAGLTDSEVWAHDFAALEGVRAPDGFCLPKAVKGAQIRSLILGWYAAHQDALSQPAGRGVYRALHENFPCHSTVAPASPAQPGEKK